MPSNTARPLRLLSVASHPPSRPASSAEFGSFLAIYDALVVRFGAAADERFTAVLNSITKARQRYNATYNAAYRARHTDGGGGEGGAHREGGVHAEVSGRGSMTPAQEAKAEVYKELGRHGGRALNGRPSHGRPRGTSSKSSGLTARP